jgi:hypothetical protein
MIRAFTALEPWKTFSFEHIRDRAALKPAYDHIQSIVSRIGHKWNPKVTHTSYQKERFRAGGRSVRYAHGAAPLVPLPRLGIPCLKAAPAGGIEDFAERRLTPLGKFTIEDAKFYRDIGFRAVLCQSWRRSRGD